MTATLSVIIVSYQTRQMTLDCLRALYADLVEIPAEVWVVDNASTDGSVAAIRSNYPQVGIIANDQNAGFGRANNQAMAASGGDYILLLNTDAFVEPGAMRALLRYLENNPRVAAVGPLLLNADRSFQESILSFPSLGNVMKNRLWINTIRRWFRPVSRTARAQTRLDAGQYLCGACLMVRRSCYEAVGGFDESFFFYGEDADWQMRMRKAGWELGRTVAASVVHLHGGSGGGDRLRFTLCYFDSEERFIRKHSGKPAAMCVRVATALNSLVHLARHLYRIPARRLNRRTEDFPARFAWRLLLQQFSARGIPRRVMRN